MLFRKNLKLLHKTGNAELLIRKQLRVVVKLQHVVLCKRKLLHDSEIEFIIDLASIFTCLYLFLLLNELGKLVLLLNKFVGVSHRCLSQLVE
jgi:hypothetical protein